MEKILVTGANSYVGTSFEKWVSKWSDEYYINTIDLKRNQWSKMDFSGYEVILHVAGIVHIKETKTNSNLYYSVNRDLTYEVAKKAKRDGAKQFVFLSSMSVYGLTTGVISKDTELNPKSNYGKAKLQAENLLLSLEDDNFIISIIRAPIIYGKGCKGNYLKLSKFASLSPVFPKINNKRSMIYVDNLCELLRLIINNKSPGIFCPQNKEYVCTSLMIKLIGNIHGKNIMMVKMFNPILRIIKSETLNKVFGDLIYDKTLSQYSEEYSVIDFDESIRLTEEEF